MNKAKHPIISVNWKDKFVLLIFLLSIFCFFGLPVKHASAAWLDSAWNYRKAITINHEKVSEDLTNFPVLFSLSGLSDINENGTDIRFTASDGITQLPREVESYFAGGLTAWAKIPTISSTTDIVVYMYYGNATATEPAADSAYGSQNVWINSYSGVWHMGTSLTAESSANGKTASSTGVSATAGKFGGGGGFNGTSSYMEVGAVTDFNPAQFTASFWETKTDRVGEWHVPMSKEIWDTQKGWFFYSTDVGDDLSFTRGGHDTPAPDTSTTVSHGWHYVVGTYNGTTLKLYVDGVSAGQSNVAVSAANTILLNIGCRHNNTGTGIPKDYFKGTMDEARFSSAARSVGWVSTEYNNQSSPGTFYAVSGQETQDSTAPTVFYYSPADNAAGVNVNANFEIAFNEAIATSTGNITLYKTSDNSVVEIIDIAGNKVTASSTNALIINPNTTLASETGYYFIIDSTAIDDTSGNGYAGIAASTAWNFTTGDFNSPTVFYYSPADNAAGVNVNANFEIAFNEAIATSTGNITLYKTSDNSVVEIIDIAGNKVTASSTNALIINPSSSLNFETEYYFTITNTCVDDLSGNSFAGISVPTVWNFITEDTPACPSVDHAETYNSYPTCGAAVCQSGYNLSDGVCVSFENSIALVSPSIGSGQYDTAIPMNESRPIGYINSGGVNILGYINSTAGFNALVSQTMSVEEHELKVVEMDIASGRMSIKISSSSQIIALGLGESKDIDLDGDGLSDIALIYNDLKINRADLTIKQLIFTRNLAGYPENSLIKEKGKPAVYKIENNKKRPFFNEQSFLTNGYLWKNIQIADDLSTIPSGDTIYVKINNALSYTFIRDLKLGMFGQDVKELQKFLNGHGIKLGVKGPGSPGKETKFFGYATRQAIIKFQEKYSEEILKPLGLKIGTGVAGASTRAKIHKISGWLKE